MATKTKYVYFFGDGKAEGNAGMRAELGGKGANLAEMASIGLPVPSGFTISTDVCKYFYDNGKKYPTTLNADVDVYLAKLERSMGKKLGDAADPLLVSVRSGAAISMPGMMDTILNLGLNDKSVEGLAKKTNNPRFAWDAYRRFIQMFGDVAMGVPHDEFEEAISVPVDVAPLIESMLNEIPQDEPAIQSKSYLSSTLSSPDEALAEKEFVDTLIESSKHWDKTQRDVFDLYFIEGFNEKDCTMILKLPPEEINGAIQKIHEIIREKIIEESFR